MDLPVDPGFSVNEAQPGRAVHQALQVQVGGLADHLQLKRKRLVDRFRAGKRQHVEPVGQVRDIQTKKRLGDWIQHRRLLYLGTTGDSRRENPPSRGLERRTGKSLQKNTTRQTDSQTHERATFRARSCTAQPPPIRQLDQEDKYDDRVRPRRSASRYWVRSRGLILALATLSR